MARRPLGPRRKEDSTEDVLDRSSPHTKSHSFPHITFCLLLIVVIFLLFYVFGNSVYHNTEEENRVRRLSLGDEELRFDEGDHTFSDFLTYKDGYLSSRPDCRAKICGAIPILQQVYGNILRRTLHIGPGTCGVVSKLLNEDVEVWGIQPFDMKEPIHPLCETLVRKGIVRVRDPYKRLPYRKNSFSLVLVTGTLDRMKPKELNQTLLDLASVSSHSLVLVVGSGLPQQSSKRIGVTKIQKPLKPRSRAWWQRRLEMVGLKEDEEYSRKFEDLQLRQSYKTMSNIFHLRVSRSH